MPRFIDLSLTIEESPSEDIPVEIEYFDHEQGAKHMEEIFGVPIAELPNGLGWAGERVRMITHSGTHMDAPYHYGPQTGNVQALTIDNIEIDECVGDGIVLDFRRLDDGETITLPLFLNELEKGSLRLAPGNIVLFCTGRDRYWGQVDYKDRGPGVGSDVVEHCVQHGLRVLGIDAWGFDRPFCFMRNDYKQGLDPKVVWPAHFTGRHFPYLQIEKLCNLDQLLGKKSRIFCPPIKIRKAGAGWCRAFAELA